MLKKFSVLLVALLLPIAVVAQSNATVTASGTVASSCSFGSITPGVFGGVEIQPNIVSTNPSTGGTSAVVNVTYAGSPVLSLSPDKGFLTKPAGSGSAVMAGSMTSVSNGSTPQSTSTSNLTLSTGNADVVYVDIYGMFTDGFKSGDYSAKATLSCY